METAFFFVLAFVAVVSAVLVVLFRNPVYSALSLVTTFFALAGLFVLLHAHFLAAVQVIVYAGAIMVLFLFVIMLLNLGHPEALERPVGKVRRAVVVVLMAVLVAQLGYLAGQQFGALPTSGEGTLLTDNIRHIGRLLYTDYLFPFEVVSVILLVALVGVIVLVKRDRPGAAPEAPETEET
jgi:NADH-quinone oxidoreductase subunit J